MTAVQQGDRTAMGATTARRVNRRTRRRRKVSALLPVLVLPTVLISPLEQVVLASASPGTGAMVAEATVAQDLVVPTEPIEEPASITEGPPPGIVVSADEPTARQRAETPSTSANGIPAAALAAYQRAETIINAADDGCRLDWELLAAIGRVESDHGRYGGNRLTDDGVSSPGIVGIALDGSNDTARIADSDGGDLDGDATWDRAVGPMQFIPTTWAVVGVDADGDGERNPQDIDDAALGAAVYLCSGAEDLATDEGRQAAVFRYNHSSSYVAMVLRLRDAYASGDYSAVPNSTASTVYYPPSGGGATVPVRTGNVGGAPTGPGGPGSGGPGGSGPGGPGGGGGGGQDGGGPDVSTDPNAPTVPNPPEPPPGAVLSAAEAAEQCRAEGEVDNPLRSNDAYDRCVASYTA